MIQTEGKDIAKMDFPRYGHIYDVNLDPVVGSEIGKRRPAVVGSNDVNNEYANTVTVIPITGQPRTKQYPFEVLLPEGIGGLTLNSRAKCNQIRTVDKIRLVTNKGALPPQYLPQIQEAIKVHLNIM